MRTHTVVWRLAVALAVILAVAGTLGALPLAALVGIGSCLALFGAMMGLAFKTDLSRVSHPVRLGAALAIAPGLMPGLVHVLGPAAAGVCGVLLIVTSPRASSWLVSLMRGRVLPSQTQQAGMAPPHDALRRQWEESTRMLDSSTTLRERLLVVNMREQILEDLLEQAGGVLPEYVWAEPRGQHGLGRSGMDT